MKKITLIVAGLIILSCFIIVRIVPFNGISMTPTIKNKEILYITKVYFNVLRNDIILYNLKNEQFVKRVIAIGGDTIKIEDGKVFLQKKGSDNYIKLKEGFLDNKNQGNTYMSSETKSNKFIVPENEYFLMGDNRLHSLDSRSCFGYNCSNSKNDNYIKKENIIGILLK